MGPLALDVFLKDIFDQAKVCDGRQISNHEARADVEGDAHVLDRVCKAERSLAGSVKIDDGLPQPLQLFAEIIAHFLKDKLVLRLAPLTPATRK